MRRSRLQGLVRGLADVLRAPSSGTSSSGSVGALVPVAFTPPGVRARRLMIADVHRGISPSTRGPPSRRKIAIATPHASWRTHVRRGRVVPAEAALRVPEHERLQLRLDSSQRTRSA